MHIRITFVLGYLITLTLGHGSMNHALTQNPNPKIPNPNPKILKKLLDLMYLKVILFNKFQLVI